jgi:hypothetical protein
MANEKELSLRLFAKEKRRLPSIDERLFLYGSSKNPILFSIYFYFGLNELPSVGSALRSFCKILIYYDRDNS